MSKRRMFSPVFKAQRVLAVLTGAKSVADICREHKLKPGIISRWKASVLPIACCLGTARYAACAGCIR
jgi:hypothetical protein